MSEPDAVADRAADGGSGSASDSATGRRRSRTGRRIARMRGDGGTDEHVVMYFKERIYATFTGLAIVLVVTVGDSPKVGHAVLALILGVLGITAAGFVSDIISHLVVHHGFPSRREFGMLLRISGGAMSTLVTPLILLALAAWDVLVIETALFAAIIVYVATLGVIGWFAVRRSHIPWWQQFIAMAMLVVLGLVVVVLQTLAHSE